MGAFARGDIVLFPFPFTDLSNRKLRPCLVISKEMGQDIILCQITSTRIKRDKYSVPVGKRDTANGSLRIDSFVRANMIFTANKALIERKVCRLKKSHYDVVVNKIIDIISN